MSTSYTAEGMNSKTTLADGAPMALRPETPTGPGTPKALDGGSMSITESTTTKTDVDPMKQPTLLVGRRLFLVFIGFLVSFLLTALDQTIVATALPRIASDFDALNQLSWIVSAFFLTQAGLMLTFCQFLTIAKTKYLFLVAIVVFELGSLICGVSQSVEILIFGRAVQGAGASGIFTSIITVISQVTRLEDRPVLFATFGLNFALASVAGPLLGGAFTEKVTWRWCFFINLPLGAISIIMVTIWLPADEPIEPPEMKGLTTWQKWMSLDWLGSALWLGAVTPFLLALQWGGQTRPWDDKVVITCFVVAAVDFCLFVVWEYRMGKRAMVPLSIFKRRTQIGAVGAAFFLFFILISGTYYLPFYYQAKGRGPTQSGIDVVPFMLSLVLTVLISGGIIQKQGRYWPFLVIGPLFAAPGAGLLFTIDVNTSTAKLIGYQILLGFGVGMSFQNTAVSIQAEYAFSPEIISQATSLMMFSQLIGGGVGVAVGGTVFGSVLRSQLAGYSSTIPPETIEMVRQSVTAIFTLPEEIQAPVIAAYVKALDYALVTLVPAAGAAGLFSLLVKNHNLLERSAAATAHTSEAVDSTGRDGELKA